MSIPITPERIGTLNSQQAADFSKPFRHKWEYFRQNDRLNGMEDIVLDPQDVNFGLPSSYEQFLPAISLAVEHEASVREDYVITLAALTIRQYGVREGCSQQDGPMVGSAHRDEMPNVPLRLYTVADVSPTEYYPHRNEDAISIALADDEPTLRFKPYEIVVASGAIFHRSPPLSSAAIRTFMRIAYTYAY